MMILWVCFDLSVLCAKLMLFPQYLWGKEFFIVCISIFTCNSHLALGQGYMTFLYKYMDECHFNSLGLEGRIYIWCIIKYGIMCFISLIQSVMIKCEFLQSFESRVIRAGFIRYIYGMCHMTVTWLVSSAAATRWPFLGSPSGVKFSCIPSNRS